MNKIYPPENLEGNGYIRAILFGLFVALPLLALVQHGIIMAWGLMQ